MCSFLATKMMSGHLHSTITVPKLTSTQYYSIKPQLLADLYYWSLQHQLLTCPFAEYYVRLQTIYRIKHVSVLMFSFLSHTAAVLAVHILRDTLLSHVRDGDTESDPEPSWMI